MKQDAEIYPTLRSRLLTKLLIWFFKLLYHPFAWTYDLVASVVSLGQWKNWVISSAELLRGPRVLEVGFGPGHLQVYLKSLNWQVFGVDESMQMCRQANGRLRRQKLPARLARGLGQVLPFPPESFNSVVATFPTNYIVRPETLAEIRRVLRPGGRFVILFSAWITGQSVPEKAVALLNQVTGQVPGSQERELFERPFDQSGLKVEIQFIEYQRSRLLFIVAEKESTGNEIVRENAIHG